MNPLIQYFLYRKAEKRVNRTHEDGWKGRRIYDEFIRIRAIFIHILKDTSFILLGFASAGFGLKGFLLPNSFIDGGVTGISLLTRV